MSKSRVSQKSQLTPSSTKGSNAINLGKDSGVNLGKKTQTSVTSGGIGITQEVVNVSGLSVKVGGNVDITPLDFGININPSEGSISVATGAEVPGGIVGVSGGVEIDLNTGKIIGGSIGGEALGFGINVSNSKKGGAAVEFTIQIPGTPIELSLGFGFTPPKPLPTPTPTPTPNTKPGVGSLKEEIIPLLDDKCLYSFVYFSHPGGTKYTFDKPLVHVGSHPTYGLGNYQNNGKILTIEGMPLGSRSPAYIDYHDYPVSSTRVGFSINGAAGFAGVSGNGINSSGIILDPQTFIAFSGGSAGVFESSAGGIKHWMNT